MNPARPPVTWPSINPMRSMPATQFDRSLDPGPPQPGGGPTLIPPLWLRRASSTEVIVQFGQVNGITPTNVNTPLTITGTATWNIYLHATLGADGIPTAVEVLTSTFAVPADGDNDAYQLIGEADVDSDVVGEIRPSLAWSQSFVACGRDASDPTTTPGTYYWELA